MRNPIRRYIWLAKRWLWLIILGVFICAGATYVVSKHMRPTYQASATLILELGTDPTHAFDNVSASIQAAQTYSQLITGPSVLSPVIANHPGMTLQQLSDMLSVKSDASTQLIEVDVQNADPKLAAQLANEVSQSFAQFANAQLPGGVQVVSAITPIDPIKPRPSLYAGIAALVGLGLAIALIILFESIEDRLTDSEKAQEFLDQLEVELLGSIPRLSRQQRSRSAEDIPSLAEGYRVLCANLNAMQARKPFKLLMITSALPGEGKSSIATNMAFFLALEGKQILLVDANPDRAVLDRYFHLDDSSGFTNALMEDWTLLEVESIPQIPDMPTLHVLTAGMYSSNLADLLQTAKAKQLFAHFKQTAFDYVIFDAPPLLSSATSLALAAHMQAALLVVDVSRTSRDELARARRQLERTGTTVLAVLNKIGWSGPGSGHPARDRRLRFDKSRPAISPLPETPVPEGLTAPALTVAHPEELNGALDPTVRLPIARPPKSQNKE